MCVTNSPTIWEDRKNNLINAFPWHHPSSLMAEVLSQVYCSSRDPRLFSFFTFHDCESIKHCWYTLKIQKRSTGLWWVILLSLLGGMNLAMDDAFTSILWKGEENILLCSFSCIYLLDEYLLGITDEIPSRCESVEKHWLLCERLVVISSRDLVVSL